MIPNNPGLVVMIGGSLAVVIIAISGLIILAAINTSSLPVVIPVLAGLVSSFAAVAAAVITHLIGVNFELERTRNNDTTKTNAP